MIRTAVSPVSLGLMRCPKTGCGIGYSPSRPTTDDFCTAPSSASGGKRRSTRTKLTANATGGLLKVLGCSTLNGSSYDTLTGTEVADHTGIAGQNQPNPVADFGWHRVVKIGTTLTTYYDPSYGVTYTGVGDFESKSVTGFYKFLGGTDFRVKKDGGSDMEEY
jgi:hypothetical protein